VTIKKERIRKEEQKQQNISDDLCVLLSPLSSLHKGSRHWHRKGKKEPQTHTDLATA
jgi:hypothetical protein